jgi:hypothetical protein
MSEFLQNSDAFVWSVERDHRLRSTIVTLVLLDGPPDWDDVVRRFELLSRAVPRFRQRMAPSPYPLPARWEDDPDFDLSFHLRRVNAPNSAALDTLLEIARVAAMAAFDRARPLWEATLIEGMPDGGAGLLCKLHHALTDGIGAVEMSMILFDRTPQPRQLAAVPSPHPTRNSEPFGFIRDLTSAGLSVVRDSLTVMPKSVVEGIRRPIGTALEALTGSYPGSY